MGIFRNIKLGAALCALLSFSVASSADPIQDANKLFKQGQNAQALVKVNGFLATKPKDAQARFLKGLITNEQGNSDEAIKIFSELTNDFPELPEPYNNLAVLYAGKGQYEKAKVALEMAIRTHPNYATAHENLGDIYAKMASLSYERAVQLDKTSISSQNKLALIRDLFSKGSHAAKAVTEPGAAVAAPVPPAANSVLIAIPPVTTTPVNAEPIHPAPIAAKPLVGVIAPALKPDSAKAGAEPVPDANAEVLKTMHEWVAAWSAKNTKKYFAFYSSEFKTPGGEDRSAWEAQRKKRIAAAKSIQITVSDAIASVVDEQNVSVSFRQSLRTGHLKTTSKKTMLWVKTDGQWLIAEEHTIKQ